MLRIKQLGAIFNYRAEAIKLARQQPWTYVLVTFGPGGRNPEVTPLGSRDMLDDLYEEAVTDPVSQGIAYVARFDKSIASDEPIDEGLFVATQVDERIFTKVKTVERYKPYIIGGSLLVAAAVLGHFFLKKKALAAAL